MSLMRAAEKMGAALKAAVGQPGQSHPFYRPARRPMTPGEVLEETNELERQYERQAARFVDEGGWR